MIGLAVALHLSSGHTEYLRVVDATAHRPVVPARAPHWTKPVNGSANAINSPNTIVLTRREMSLTKDLELVLASAQRSSVKVLYSLKVPPKLT